MKTAYNYFEKGRETQKKKKTKQMVFKNKTETSVPNIIFFLVGPMNSIL